MLAKQLAKTTKMTSLISNAVYNRNIQLDEMEKEEVRWSVKKLSPRFS